MPIEFIKKVFKTPYVIKKEENIRELPYKKRKNPKKSEKKEKGKIDLRV